MLEELARNSRRVATKGKQVLSLSSNREGSLESISPAVTFCGQHVRSEVAFVGSVLKFSRKIIFALAQWNFAS